MAESTQNGAKLAENDSIPSQILNGTMLIGCNNPLAYVTEDFYESWCDRLNTEKHASTEPINDLSIKHGITGNLYCTSKSKKILEKVCDQINKSKNSIYFNEKYKVFAIRIKAKHHKRKIKEGMF